MSALPQTEKASDEQGATLAAIASGRLKVTRDDTWRRWRWDQGRFLDHENTVRSKAELAEEAEAAAKEKAGERSVFGSMRRYAGWDPADEDVPVPVRRVLDLHDRDWVTCEGKLTPLGLATYLGWIRTSTGVDVAIDRVPIEVPVPVQVPID